MVLDIYPLILALLGRQLLVDDYLVLLKEEMFEFGNKWLVLAVFET
jgi:hypothetical protein